MKIDIKKETYDSLKYFCSARSCKFCPFCDETGIPSGCKIETPCMDWKIVDEEEDRG